MVQGKIYIGTSGYSYENWEGDFYPRSLDKKDWLSFYAENFNSVEINNSFYRLPARETFKKWAALTPLEFVFSVKASRYITHMKKLRDCQKPLDNFFHCASGLGYKLGPVLFQLPSNLKKNADRLAGFLKELNNENSVFEFRHHSWFDDQVISILKSNRCGLAISSGPGFPYYRKILGGICYLRLHGKHKLYHSSYSKSDLKDFAEIIIACKKEGIDSYVYFNNDALGHAYRNACTLSEMLL